MKRPYGRRLFWRVYASGILVLVLTVVAAGLSSVAFDSGSGWRETQKRVARYLSQELAPHIDDRLALDNRLRPLHETFGANVAVFRADGRRVTTVGSEELEPLDAAPTEATVTRRLGRFSWVFPIGEQGAYAVVRLPRHGDWVTHLAVILAVALGLALASLPLTRAIVRPLERLTATARRLGSGDLSARSGVVRNDEVGLLAATLDDTAARLERLIENEKELLANVSHELRTPLARVRVALELAEEAADVVRVRDLLAGIGSDLVELDKLIEDVLATARLDLGSGAMPLERGEVAPADLVAVAAERFARNHPDHTLEASCADALPALAADALLLRRVFDNLLDNAARYAEPDAGPIELTAGSADGVVRIEVRDRGIGIRREDLPRVFEPFFRSDKSRNRSSGGVGLGLALCRRIIEAHGGRIGAESREGGGTVFWMTLGSS